MSRRMKDHAPYLQVLAKGNATQRQGILNGASRELVLCLCECALNVLNGNVPLSSLQKKKLSKHKSRLRQLVSKSTPIAKKKTLLKYQKGGWVSALLGPVLGVLGSLLLK